VSKGGAMHAVAFEFIINLNTLLAIKVNGIEDLKHKGFHPIQRLWFAKTKSCFGKDVS
jgi:hypothetical protein